MTDWDHNGQWQCSCGKYFKTVEALEKHQEENKK